MPSLESELLTDGSVGLLLCVEREPRGFRWFAAARRMDGGRILDTVDLSSGRDPADAVLRLRKLLIPFCRPAGRNGVPPAAHRWMAAGGRGWRMLLAEATAGIESATPPPLDIHAAALALRPALPSRSTVAELLGSFGATALPDESPPQLESWHDLLWRVIHEASARGLTFDGMLALPESDRVAPSFERCSFDEGVLRALPPSPGVYAMLDADDQVLYVGKSDCLPRRLGEYFQANRTPDAKTLKLRDRVRRLEWQVTGSELEALLWEDRWIRERNPAVNVAREVQDDASRYAAHWTPVALALPSVKPGAVECFVLLPRDAVAGARLLQIRAQPNRPPRRRIERWLAAIQGLDGPRPPPSKDGTDWGSRGAELARRYFGRHRTRMHWMELAGANVESVLAMLRHAAAEPGNPAEWRAQGSSGGVRSRA